MKKRFLYQTIASELMNKIIDRTYGEGDLLESSANLMQRYNASVITINKALGLLANLGYIKRIPGKGSVVQQSESKQDKPPGSHLIGAVVYDMAHPDIWANAVKAIENQLYPLGYQLLVGNNAGNAERMIEYIDQFSSRGIEGLVFVPLSGSTEEEFHQINTHIVKHLLKVNIPFVVMNRVLHNAGTIQVGFDNHQDALELMDALFAHNCTHPLLLSHRFHNSEIKDRERGFLESLWNHGVSDPKHTIIRLPDGSDSSTLQLDFLYFLEQELTSRPEIDALVAVDDHILKLLQMVVQSGSLFEEHPVTLTGFGTVDDVFSTGSIDIYQHQNPASLVEVAIAHLLDIINNRSLGITQIIRIPSILTFGSKAL